MSSFQFALVFAVPVLVFLVVVVAYPLAYAFYISFHDVRFFGGYRADFVWFDNYAKVFGDDAFWASAWRSLLFTIQTVILTLLIGTGLALVLRDLPRNWRWLRALIILPWAVSPYGAGIFFAWLGGARPGWARRWPMRWGSTPRSTSSRPILSSHTWRSARPGTWRRWWPSSFWPTC